MLGLLPSLKTNERLLHIFEALHRIAILSEIIPMNVYTDPDPPIHARYFIVYNLMQYGHLYSLKAALKA